MSEQLNTSTRILQNKPSGNYSEGTYIYWSLLIALLIALDYTASKNMIWK
jgi:hypothetical protein